MRNFVLNGGMKAMRFVGPALVAVCLVQCCHEVAAESDSGWWQFDHQNETTLSQPQGVASRAAPVPALSPSAVGPVTHEVFMPQSSTDATNAANGNSSWFHLPHWAPFGSYPQQPQMNPQRNAWATRNAPPKTPPSPLQSVKNGAHKVVAGTKAAYHKTIAALTPGGTSKRNPSTGHFATSDTRPPFWKRMFGVTQPEPQQPQTIPQWMAQKRLDP
jgi:hypothetical protein